MPDYKNGKIYKLWSPEGDDIYIGSTTISLSRRKAKHKSQNNTSKILFEKYTDVRIELLEEYPCDNKEQLLKKEGEYIRNNNCVNRCIAGTTRKEQNKNYYENNKEKINENNKEQILCECGRTVRLGDKSRHLKTNIHNKLKSNVIIND